MSTSINILKTTSSTTFVNLATFSEFDDLVISKDRDSLFKSINTIHKESNINGKDWVGYKIENLYSFNKDNLTSENLSFVGMIPRSADYHQKFLLHFENCNDTIIDSIQFLVFDQVFDHVSRQWIDIYNQMYDNTIKSDNTLIIPSHHYRHNIYALAVIHPYSQYSIRINFIRPLVGNESVCLYSQYGVCSGAVRFLLGKNFNDNNNFFYDRVLSEEFDYKIFERENVIDQIWKKTFEKRTEEPLATLSDVFISVKKLSNYPEGKELIQSLSFSFEKVFVYENEPIKTFRDVYPKLQNLNKAKENDEYQNHYLISFAETSKPHTKDWHFRGGVNLSKIAYTSLSFKYDETIPKDSYKIEISLVCPTRFDLKDYSLKK